MGEHKANLLLFVVSLVVSLLLWTQVQPAYNRDKQREFQVPLELRDLPENLMALEPPDTVTMVAEGSQAELDALSPDDVQAYVDLSNATSDRRTYAVQVNAPMRKTISVRLPRPTVELRIERRASRSQDVVVALSGSPPSEYEYDGASIQPPNVKISGPESSLRNVRTARVTLDLARIRPGAQFTLDVELLDASNLPVPFTSAEPPTVVVSPGITNAPAAKRVIVVPNFQGQPAFGFRVIGYDLVPSQLDVAGESSALAAISTLTTEPIDLTDLKADSTIQTKIQVPQGVRLVNSNGAIRAVVKIAATADHTDAETP